MKKIPLSSNSEKLLDEYHAYKEKEKNAIAGWAKRIVQTRKNVRNLQRKFRDLLYQNLQEAYQVYIEATRSEYGDTFFAEIRGKLYKVGIKNTKNTKNAAVIIRYISAEEVKPKTVYDWSKALILAERSNVPADQFASWLKSKTISGAVDELKKLGKNDYDKKDRMHRARRIILRVIEGKEIKPLAQINKVVAHTFEREHVSATGLVLAIGTLERRYDRESFYADVNLSTFLVPDNDLELLIIDKLAKELVDRVEYFEQKFEELDEQEWGEEVWERLVASEEEAEAAQKKQIT